MSIGQIKGLICSGMISAVFALLFCSISCTNTAVIPAQESPNLGRSIEIPDSPGFNQSRQDGSDADNATKAEAPDHVEDDRYQVKINLLNVRSGPGMSYPPVRQVKEGTILTIEECTQIWCRIKEGEYVGRRHLTPLTNREGKDDHK